jgi:phosphoribosyl 1,2-cyclic phosphate phosphodiesterase
MADSSAALRVTVLGSGTSVGVPTIGCSCDVCTSSDPRDKRLRPSIWIQYGGRSIIVDTGPDFRYQALRSGIPRVDAILFTHAHADHIMGLDDVRPYNFRQQGPIPIYGSDETLDSIQRCFAYIFAVEPKQSWVPKLEPRLLNGSSFDLFGIDCMPIPVKHGESDVLGFRFGSLAYLTDHSSIPETSMDLLRGLDVLFLDALRHKPHPTHSTVDRSLETVRVLGPGRAFFTHIGHDLRHERTEQLLPPHVRLAYDGLEIEVALDGRC